MKEDQNNESSERIEAAIVETGAVIGDDDGIVGNADDSKDQQDHDGAKPSQGRTELEHVPSHYCSGSVHTQKNKRGKKIKRDFSYKFRESLCGSDSKVYGFLAAGQVSHGMVMREIETERRPRKNGFGV